MLDHRTSALLQAVNGQCAGGGFKIFAAEDFSAATGEEWSDEQLSASLAYLSDEGFIAVKYSGGGMYCVRPLPLGKGYYDHEEEKETESEYRDGKTFRSALLGGVLGGAAGGFLGAFLFFLLDLLLSAV